MLDNDNARDEWALCDSQPFAARLKGFDPFLRLASELFSAHRVSVMRKKKVIGQSQCTRAD